MNCESKVGLINTVNKIGRIELEQTGQDGICKLIDSLVNAVQVLDQSNEDTKLALEKLNEVLSAIDFTVEG